MKKKPKKTEPAPVTKNEKARKAAQELEKYFKDHKLDPLKDWTQDKKHGKKVLELVAIANANRDKVVEEGKKKTKEKKEEPKPKTKVVEKPKTKGEEKIKRVKATVTTYDYPLVDGKPMTAEEKKKYRVKMRAEAKKGNKPEKAEKKTKVEKVVDKPSKTKKVIKKKKAKKEED